MSSPNVASPLAVASSQQSGIGPEFVGVNWQVYLDTKIAALTREIDNRLEVSKEDRINLHRLIDDKAAVTHVLVNDVRIDLKSDVEKQHQSVLERFAATERMQKQIQDATSQAISKAERATEIRFESVNEFRKQLGDQAATFITRQAFEEWQKGEFAYRDNVSNRINGLTDRLNTREGEKAGAAENKTEARASTASVVGLAVGAATLATYLINFVVHPQPSAPTTNPAAVIAPSINIPPGYTLVPSPQAK